MSQAGEFLPRVIIEKSENQGSIHINFKTSARGFNKLPETLKKMFAILDDWTAYCIASIEHMPYMSAVGHIIISDEIQNEIIAFLKKTAIAYEEQHINDKDSPSQIERHSFIIHEEDISFVAGRLSTTSHLIKAAQSIQRSNLSAIIAEFDYLMFRTINFICENNPSILVSDEEVINIGFLRNGGNFEDWQKEQIEKK